MWHAATPTATTTIVDRVKDMYISGGENVYPAEVEQVLLIHPAVADAAVVGVPDERWGEVGKAWIVARPGAVIDPEEIRAFCRERLAAYKVPKHVEVLDALPRNAAGKILKGRLRAVCWSEEFTVDQDRGKSRIRTNASVSRILVEQGRGAVGVRTATGEEFRGKDGCRGLGQS